MGIRDGIKGNSSACTAKGANCPRSSQRSALSPLISSRHRSRPQTKLCCPRGVWLRRLPPALRRWGPSKSRSLCSLISDKPSSRQAGLLLQGEGGTGSAVRPLLPFLPSQNAWNREIWSKIPPLCALEGGLNRYNKQPDSTWNCSQDHKWIIPFPEKPLQFNTWDSPV